MKTSGKIILIIGILLSLSFSPWIGKNDLQEDNIKGKVKRIAIKYFDVIDSNRILISKDTICFNEDGYKTSTTSYTEQNIIRGESKYKYHVNDNLCEEYNYYGADSLESKHIFSYDAKLKSWKESNFDGKGKLINWYITRREPDLIRQINYDTSGVRLIYELIYDKNKNLINESSYTWGGHLYIRYIFAYENGKKISYERADKSGNKLKGEYKYSSYDTKGNWEKREEIINGKVSGIAERMIGYY